MVKAGVAYDLWPFHLLVCPQATFVVKCHYKHTMYSIKFTHGCIVISFIVVTLLVPSRFIWTIDPYHSGWFHWHWGNCKIVQCQWNNHFSFSFSFFFFGGGGGGGGVCRVWVNGLHPNHKDIQQCLIYEHISWDLLYVDKSQSLIY